MKEDPMLAEPFRIHVPDDTLTDMFDRLARTRYVTTLGTVDRPGGLGGERLRALVDRWLQFDWRAEEVRLNGFEQYTAEVNGHRLHFARLRPQEKAKQTVPLLLLHGWPSAFTEYLPLAELLSASEGSIGFDVIVPSLPGFVFSELPDATLTRREIAADLHALMVDVLGFERYGAFGGDIGGGAAMWIGVDNPDSLIGLQLIHAPVPAGGTPLDDIEQAYLEAVDAYDRSDSGYSEIMLTRPDTIAATLADSPAGLLAWIVDKWYDWVDGELGAVIDDSVLFDIATLYWATGTIGSSFRQYFDWNENPPRPPITAPIGVLLSREPAMRGFPRSLAERAATDLRRFEQASAGGHFMGVERPEIAAAAIRSFFASLRDGGATSLPI
jgi:pimeloyl-ACP methyl ester carboxylesterase